MLGYLNISFESTPTQALGPYLVNPKNMLSSCSCIVGMLKILTYFELCVFVCFGIDTDVLLYLQL